MIIMQRFSQGKKRFIAKAFMKIIQTTEQTQDAIHENKILVYEVYLSKKKRL